MLRVFLINFLTLFSDVLFLLILARVVLSFIPSGLHRFRLFIYSASEPLLAPIRKLIPPLGGAIDLSPIIPFLVIQVLIELIGRFL